MKIPSSVVMRTALVLVSASLLLAAASVRAGGFYLGADAGVSVPDGDLVAIFNGNGRTSLNTGARVDLLTGYAFRLCDRFSLGPELEVGYLYNSFDKGSSGGQNASGGGDVNQVPILANVVLSYHITPAWSVYAGAGAGLEYLNVSVSSSSPLSDLETKQGGVAFDAKLGVQYHLGPGDLGLSYQYLGINPGFFYQNFGNHTIMASFTFHF
jgi:opacity protein-like surface antigen